MSSTQYMRALLADPTRLREFINENETGFISLLQGLLGEEDTPDTSQGYNSTSQAPEANRGSKSEKHPDPAVFNGNPSKWKEFKTQLRVKLVINADRYPTSQSRLAYGVSRLQGNPLNIITPRIVNGTIGFNDFVKGEDAPWGGWPIGRGLGRSIACTSVQPMD